MIIQPYFPEPETVAGNVAAARHPVRIGFVRRVMFGYALAIALAVGVGVFAPPVDPYLPGIALVATLILLTMSRRLSGGGKRDRAFAVLAFPVTLVSLGILVANVCPWTEWGCAALTALLVPLYTALSGRDFSFVGAFVLSFGAAAAGWVGLAFAGWIPWAALLWALLSAGIYGFFVTYDLASLLRRRRLGEEFEAVVDLFRDSLNIVTYAVRVWGHWRSFRI